jgi:hypothetical protein
MLARLRVRRREHLLETAEKLVVPGSQPTEAEIENRRHAGLWKGGLLGGRRTPRDDAYTRGRW